MVSAAAPLDPPNSTQTPASTGHEAFYFIPKSRYAELDGDFYEGGDNYFILQKSGSLDAETIATVVIRELTDAETKAGIRAEAGKDFVAETLQVTFKPGQSSARVPLKILNDTITEAPQEHFAILHTSSTANSTLILNNAVIVDNDFNPLLAAERSPAIPFTGGAVRRLSTGDLVLVTSQTVSFSKTNVFDSTIKTRVTRLTPNGQLDTNFNVANIPGRNVSIYPAENGDFIFLQDETMWMELESHYTVNRLTSKNVPSRLLSMYDVDGILAAVPSTQNRFFIVSRRKLALFNDSGEPDPDFQLASPPLSISAVIPDDHGGVYLTGTFRIGAEDLIETARVDPSGAITWFAPGEPTAVFVGIPYVTDPDTGLFRKYSASGQLDSAFTPFALKSGSVHVDEQGRLYRFAEFGENWILVDRFNADGTPDPNFATATIDALGDIVLVAGNEALLATPQLRVNGVRMLATEARGISAKALVRLNLSPATGPTIRIEPARSSIYERGSGLQQYITIIRTGPNELPLNGFSYRIRNGAAVAGRDFTATLEGPVDFGPGTSAIRIPISAIDNSDFAPDANFFVDFISDAHVFSTSEMTIVNDEIKLVIEPDGPFNWIIAKGGDIDPITIWSTSDFKDWKSFGPTRRNFPILSLTPGPQEYEFFIVTGN